MVTSGSRDTVAAGDEFIINPRNLVVTKHALSKTCAALALAICAVTSLAEATGHFRVLERYAIGGEDASYDYLRLDPDAQRLYVAHGSRVEVLSTTTGKVVGQITDTPGVHGIALATAFGHGFTSNGTDRSVTMFDLRTFKSLMVIRYTGIKPDAIEYDPDTRRVFVVNGAATGDVTVIAPDTGAIIGIVALKGGKLEQLAFDQHGRGFVNDEEQGVVHVFDTHTLQSLGTWPVSPGSGPTGIALDAVHHRLFSACGNRKLVALDSDTGAVVATAPIGSDPDGAAFDGARGLIFTSNRDGTLTVVHEDGPDQYSVLQNVATESGARTLALDGSSGRVYLPAAKFGPAPAPSKTAPEPRAPMVAASFAVLVVGQ
jgi:DNA-binding beta-propeller fold protein YncE